MSRANIIFLVTALSVASVRGQLTWCRASIDCNGAPGDDLGPVLDPRDCCVGNPLGVAYVPMPEGACIACVVVGFINATYSGVEQGPGHLLQVGYQKGAAIARQNLLFSVQNTPGTAKLGSQFDYTVNTMQVRTLWTDTQPNNVVITFCVDAIAQEPNETFTLALIPRIQPTPREGLFFLNTIQVTIQDIDNVQFAFTEDDFQALEPDTRGLPVLVTKSTRIATRVELMVIPYTVPEARIHAADLPPNIPMDDDHSPPFANFNDFNNTNITIVFEPDEDAEFSELGVPIFVTDDDINEANEQVFVIELILVDSLSPVDLNTRRTSLCRIIDNDLIRIGFELPGYTYIEPEFITTIDEVFSPLSDRPDLSQGPIYLIKENNVISEQNFLVSIQVTDSPPSDPSIQAATFGVDYLFGGRTSATKVFLAFQRRILVLFTLRRDNLPEGTEAFQASVSPEDTRMSTFENGTLRIERFPTSLNPINTASEVFVIILDDDPIIIGFTNTSYTVDEGVGTLQVDIQVFNPPDDQSLPAAVSLVVQSVPGSAIGGSDYQEINAATLDVFLTFDDNNRRQSFDVTIIDDSEFELDVEDFTLELRFDPFLPPSPNLELSPNVSAVEILDNDLVEIGFLDTSYTVGESDGQVTIQIGVISNGTLGRAVTVQFSTSADSADASSDYSESVVEFTFDSVTREVDVSVPLVGDNIFELTEMFGASLAFPGALPPRVTLTPASAQVTILDDDEIVIGFLNTSYTVDESDGNANIQIGVIRGSLQRPVTVEFSTIVISAANGSDYNGLVRQFTFKSIERSVDISVPIIGNDIFELTELFGASLAFQGLPPAEVVLAPASTQVTILDDDVLIFGFGFTLLSANESAGSATISIHLSGNAGEFVAYVNVSTVDETATGNGSEIDYNSVVEQSIFFTTANRIQNLTVQIVSDDFTELNESFSAILTSVFLACTAGGAAIDLSDQERARLILNPDNAAITIMDDDVTVIGFQNTTLNTSEDSEVLRFNIAVLHGILGINVSINFTAIDISAQAGLDYTVTTSSLVLNNQTTVKSVYVGIIDDYIFEKSETFFGLLSAASVLPQNVHLDPRIASATIFDHKRITVGFYTDSVSLNVDEASGTVTLNVRVFNGTISEGNTVQIRVTTTDNSAHAPSDYIPISQVLTFSTSLTTLAVQISVVNDTLLESDEVLTASLSLEDPADLGYIELRPISTSLNIIDDDVAMIGFVHDHIYSVVEGIDQFANLTVQLISGQLGREVIVTFDTQSSSATNGLDYVDVLNQHLTFGPSMSSHTVHVQILDDNTFEENTENFTATLSAGIPRLQLGHPLVTMKIADNELVRIGFQSALYNVSEASIVTNIKIKVLEGSLEREIIVSFSTNDSTAIAGEDYAGLTSHLLTFDSSNTVDVIPLVILDDEADENTETISASLSFPGLPLERVFLEPNTTVVQIEDDDNADIGFISPHFIMRESDSQVNIQVGVLSGSLQKEVTLNFFITELNAFVGEDYHQPQMLELTLNFTTNIQINISIVNDEVFELTESFFVNLSLVGGSTSQNSTEVIILDDDGLEFGFSPSMYEIHESEGPITVNVFFIYGNPGDYQPLVLISTHNGTATEGTDFDAISSTQVPFTVSNRVSTLAIPVISSNSTESSEEFSVTLDEVILIHTNNRTRVNLSDQERARLMLNPRRASVTILDDSFAIVGFLNTNLSIFEGEGTLNFTIGVLQGYLDTFVTISFTTEEATAKAGVDYSINTSKLLDFTGDSVHSVSIQIIDDDISEPPETFFGLLSSANVTTLPPNIRLEPTRATATIVNNNDLTRSEESNSTITLLAVVLACTLAFLALITAVSLVACFVYKKSKRKILNMQEHVYESVSLPPTTLVTFSEPAKLEYDLYDEVKTASGSAATEFELMDNEVYTCSSPKPSAAAEVAPNTDQTESADHDL